ncbi:MAG TPA: AAA family ATPase [Frateuria sp.]|uniref:AAA family ATPase n=1 Tax=Frateuria sp. TaxID=2211372 RepID=UPI002DE80725|nr:AAA family ATPase [Frateuria sp.]
MSGLLIVLAGLPGAGKTTLARALAARTGAVHLRIDTIEQALRHAGIAPEEEGYAIAMALAGDQLALGHVVIADAVNAVEQARRGWRATAAGAQARLVEIEVCCSDAIEHRRRVETRRADIAGLELPDWARVSARDYAPWDHPPLRIDTAHRTADDCVAELLPQLPRATDAALARDQA